MKKRLLALTLVLCMVVSLLPATVLAETESVAPTAEDTAEAVMNTPTEIRFDQDHITGYIGFEDVLSYSFNPYGTSEEVTMTSSDTSVADVVWEDDPGWWVLIPNKLGTATITATSASGLVATCPVTVKEIETLELEEKKTVTVYEGDIVVFYFTPDETAQYSFVSEDGKGTLNVASNYKPYYSDGVDTYWLTKGETVRVALWNHYYDDLGEYTFTVCIKKSVPLEKITVRQEVYTGYPGNEMVIRFDEYPLWHMFEDYTLTSSDTSVATIEGRWLTMHAPGTATVTITSTSGITATCQVKVLEPEIIHVNEEKVITMYQGEERQFSFTPETSGEYVFYASADEIYYDENGRITGSSNSAILEIYEDGERVGESISTYSHHGKKCYMEAGKTYILSVEQFGSEGECVTRTACIQKLENPQHVYFEKEKLEVSLDRSQFDLYLQSSECVFFPDGITWMSSDPNVVDVYGTKATGYCSVQGIGTVTITATLANGVSASCQITVIGPESEPIRLNEEKTLTLEYGEKKLYSFTPAEDGYYAFYTPRGEYVQGPDDLWLPKEFALESLSGHFASHFESDYNGIAGYMYAGKTYYFRVSNVSGLEDTITSTVCIERNDPPTAITLNQDRIELVKGAAGQINATYETSAKFIVGVEWSSSDTDIVLVFNMQDEAYLEPLNKGTATITATLPNGATASCQVTVKDREPIELQKEKTITLGARCSSGYLFTPEVSGEYVFVTNQADGWIDPETGVWYSGQFEMDIAPEGGYMGYENINNKNFQGVCAYLEAGQTYKMTVRNINNFGSLTGTILVDYYQEPQDLFFTVSQNYAWVGEVFQVEIFCNEGFMKYAQDITWTSSNPSVISVFEDVDNQFSPWGIAWLEAKNPGVAKVTGTLKNGESISQTITVHEAGVYTVIDGADSVVPEGEDQSLTIRADGHLAWFEGIKVDGKEVAEENYTATSGSTIIELHADYLATLTPGKHTLDICFQDGNATTSFTIEDAKPEVEFVGASLSLKGDIGLNYYAALSERILSDSTAYMNFTGSGAERKVAISQGVYDSSDGSYRYSIPLNAKNMGDDVTAQVYAGGKPVGNSKTLSIKYYADYVINNSSKQNFVNLMKAMLNYGAAAQVNFGYDTSNLVNADMSAADRTLPATLDVSGYAHTWSGEEAGIEVTSASLLLQSETKIRIYFKLASGKTIDDYVFTIDGAKVTPVQSGSEYYIEKTNVAAKDLDTMYTFRLGNRQLTYCGLSYVNQVINYSKDADLLNLVKSLYAYNQAANDYFGK